ncbi:MAG: DUF3467 domain-containing protein [Bryobacteraceae bacterium]
MAAELQFDKGAAMAHPDKDLRPSDTRYANHLKVGFNRDEFIIDVGQHFSDSENFFWRVVCTPPHAKEFLTVLRESLKLYEAEYGPIRGLEEA